MSHLSTLLAAVQARLDARDGIDAKDRRMTAVHGIAPAEAERGSFLHREAVEAVSDTARLEEYREDVRRGEDAQALVGRPAAYTAALAATWALEFAGSLLVLRSLGVPDAHRVLPAAALTLSLVALTKVAVSPAKGASPATPEASPADAPPAPFPFRRYAVALAYGLLILAIALVRVAGSDGDDAPAAVLWSEAAIMIAVSVGPAAAAAWLERRRAPMVELARQLRTLRARTRAEERRIARARAFLRGLDRAQVAWAQDNARGRAAYSVAHERTLAARSRADEGDGT